MQGMSVGASKPCPPSQATWEYCDELVHLSPCLCCANVYWVFDHVKMSRSPEIIESTIVIKLASLLDDGHFLEDWSSGDIKIQLLHPRCKFRRAYQFATSGAHITDGLNADHVSATARPQD